MAYAYGTVSEPAVVMFLFFLLRNVPERKKENPMEVDAHEEQERTLGE